MLEKFVSSPLKLPWQHYVLANLWINFDVSIYAVFSNIIIYIFLLDVFSQVSDSNGLLMMWRFAEYLQEVLALPAAVYESPTFYYDDVLPSTIFSPVKYFSPFTLIRNYDMVVNVIEC